MIFYWKKIVNKLKTLFAFELWTVHQFQGLASFSEWTVSVLLASLCLWYSCFCLFIMVTFLAPLRYVQLLQHLLSETWGGDWVGRWTVFCPYCGREARTVLHAIWPAFKISSGNFFFHNWNCFELCTMCVFKLLVEFFNEWALYFAKSGLKVFWRILNGKPYSLIGQSCMGFSTIEVGNLSRGLY